MMTYKEKIVIDALEKIVKGEHAGGPSCVAEECDCPWLIANTALNSVRKRAQEADKTHEFVPSSNICQICGNPFFAHEMGTR